MTPDLDLKEGPQSKKYQLAWAALILISGGWLASNWLPTLGATFNELITGIMGVLMLYFTGNVGNKFVVGHHMVQASKINSINASVNTSSTSITTPGGTNVTEFK